MGSKAKYRCFWLCILIFTIAVSLPCLSPDAGNLNRVLSFLNEYSVPFERRQLLADYGGFGTSLVIQRSHGVTENPNNSVGTFVLAVPLYAEFAVDTAMALAKKIKDPALLMTKNIIIAFLGDEQNDLPEEFGGIINIGFRDLLTLNDMPENWVLCYLDAKTAPEEIIIRHGIGGYVAPLEIVKPLPFHLSSKGIPWSFKIRYNEIYKLGLVEGPQPLFIAWDEEINGFVLSGGEVSGKNRYGQKHPDPVLPGDLADVFLDYTGSLALPILKADRHYSSFSLPGGSVFFLTEELTVILLIITAGLLLLLFLFFSARYHVALIFHVRLFFSHIWIFIILLPLLTISIKVSGLLYSFFFGLLGPPAYNTISSVPNYSGAGLIVLLAALLFFLPSPLLDLIRFPRRSQFYGISVVFFVLIGLLFAAFLDFSYVPVFLWALFFVFLGALVSSPTLVFLCAFFAPLFAVGTLINIIETGSGIIARLIISPAWATPSSWTAALQVALLLMPVFLLVKRGTILMHKHAHNGLELKPKRKNRLYIISILTVLILTTMYIQIRLIPKNTNVPERRFLDEETDKILALSLTDILFQDNRIITLHLKAEGSPIRFDVFLGKSNESNLFQVYSASVPFDSIDDDREITFILGEDPPNPLTLEIVVAKDFEGKLGAAAIYNKWDGAIDPGEKPVSEDYTFQVNRSVTLKP